MSTQKKACVIYTKSFEKELSAVTSELANKGYNVCVSLVEQAEAEAAQAGKIQELNSDVKACIEGADICIFLIPEKNAECLAGAADHAKVSGTKIIAVVENLESIPEVFDEYASSVVSGGSSEFGGAVLGGDVWEAEKESGGGRKIQRVKCQ